MNLKVQEIGENQIKNAENLRMMNDEDE